MLPALLGFLPTLFSGVKEYVGKKQDIQKIERESAVRLETAKVEAQIRRLESADIADTELDKASLEQTGWKDEYLLLMTTAPLISIMISPYIDLYYTIQAADFVYTQGLLAKAVGEGFNEMAKLPEYYWYALGGVYVHSLGMRRMLRMVIERMNPFKK